MNIHCIIPPKEYMFINLIILSPNSLKCVFSRIEGKLVEILNHRSEILARDSIRLLKSGPE